MKHVAVKQLTAIFVIPALLLLSAACKPHDHDHHGHDHDHAHEHAEEGHHHEAPHGGAAVVLGDEAFHLEFVHDPEAGALTAYVLDGHMENFVRVTNTALPLKILLQGKTNSLALQAVANNATGETVGDTSQFSANADWLKGATNFDAHIPTLEIRQQVFTNVSFNYPKGNE